ncbi:MAG: nucleoside kinase [Clostridia bacterium]|nr:nucleoside kinase [Clostridia bacterium]
MAAMSITVTCQGQSRVFPSGIPAERVLEAFSQTRREILAVRIGGETVERSGLMNRGGELSFVTLASSEGRRIYERSLRFILLLALKKLFPGQRVRMEYSVSNGILVRMPGHALSSRDIADLDHLMAKLCLRDLPFLSQTWTTEKARAYFAREGQQDKVQLLRYRSLPTMQMYHCEGNDDMWEYFYGPMVPSTGYVSVYDLLLHADGLVLQLPDHTHPDRPAPYVDRPRHLSVFEQSARWCSILGAENISDLADMTRHDMRSFIRVNEALHDQALVDVAREIVTRARRVVLVAGPSSSGKTTFSGRLAVQLQVLGRKAVRISLDNYYRNRSDIPLDEHGEKDFEHIEGLDLPLIRQHIASLLKGEPIDVPVFSFQTGKRAKETMHVELSEQDIVIFEGIHALNPRLTEGVPGESIYRIFVSALTCLNLDDHNRIRTTDVRLLRRIVRDYQFRGTTPVETLRMWDSVRRGEEKWIFPYQETADTFFNTALHYELPVLRHFSYDLLCEIDPTLECYPLASVLRKILNYVPDFSEELLEEIPPLSLLREFIGGSTMEKD